MAHIWQWYRVLSNMREWGDGGPKAILPTEIVAWSQLTGTRPLPHETRLILDLDVRFRNVQAEDAEDLSTLPEADQEMLEWVKAARMSAAV